MNPLNPWLDPIEVRRMADLLMRPDRASPAEIRATEAGFDEGFIGFAFDPEPPPTARQAAIEPAAKATEPTAEDAAPIPAPPQPTPPTGARGLSLADLNRFRDWVRQEFSATGVFILDHEGVVVFDESGHGRLHFLARSLALATRRPGASAGNVRVKISADATLELIPVETASGRLVLGAIVPQALAPATVTAVMEALARAAATPPAAE